MQRLPLLVPQPQPLQRRQPRRNRRPSRRLLKEALWSKTWQWLTQQLRLLKPLWVVWFHLQAAMLHLGQWMGSNILQHE